MQTQIANLGLFLHGRMTNWRGERMVYKMKKKKELDKQTVTRLHETFIWVYKYWEWKQANKKCLSIRYLLLK